MENAIYLRKSRADLEAEAHGEEETLARHEKALRELAQRLGLSVGAVYREIASGETLAARPVMQTLLATIESGRWEGVLVMEIERLARGDTIDQGIVAQAFKASGTKIHTPLKTYDPANEFDEEYFEFGLFMSRREFKAINRRMQRGRLASAREGKFVPGVAPYGYRRVKLDNQKGYSLAPVPEEAEAVCLIFRLYGEGRSIAAIAEALDELGIPPTQSKSWSSSSLRRILRNPVYLGQITWGGKKSSGVFKNGDGNQRPPEALRIQGLHPPLVGREEWDVVQHRMFWKSNPPVPARHRMQNPLAGLLVCGSCGRVMTRRQVKGADLLVCETTGCPTSSTRLELVEDRALALANFLLGAVPLDWDPAPAPGDIATSLAKALARKERELCALQAQRERLYTLLEQNIYSPEIFAARSTTLGRKENLLREKISGLQAQRLAQQKNTGDEKFSSPVPNTLPEIYYTLDAPKKNLLLKEIFQKIEYEKPRESRWKHPGGFRLTAYPKISTTAL